MDKRFPLEDQIEMLASSLAGRVVTPRHADYDTVRVVPLGNFDRRPVAVIRPKTAADVAAVINFAKATELELAVRSGGHSTAGHSGSEGGLVIDLRDINQLDIDIEAMTVWAGAGLTAGEVTRALEQHNVIVGFGDAATVGIGGLTVGGGVGYLARKHGLTIDFLLAAEVVTASGEIVIADADNHPDLFWAIRGGGGNFGVVTRMKFRLEPLPSFVGGPLILPATAEVIAGFVTAAEAAPEELTAIAMALPAPPLPFLPPELYGKTVFLAMMAFAGAPEAAEAALRPFRALAKPYADLVGPAPYSSMYISEDPNMRPAVVVRTVYLDRIGQDEAATMLAQLEACNAPMKMAQVRVLGGAVARVPVETTAYAHRQRRILATFLAMDAGSETARHDRWAAEAIRTLRADGADAAYVNFLALEGERLRAAYPGATWERLRLVKAKYDPQNLFRLNQNIPPA